MEKCMENQIFGGVGGRSPPTLGLFPAAQYTIVLPFTNTNNNQSISEPEIVTSVH